MRFFTDDLPPGAKAYISTVSLLGLSVLAYSAYSSFFLSNLSWLVLAGMTVVGSFFPVRLPYGKGQSFTMTVSDIFIFASILLYSPEVAVTLAVVDGILGTFHLIKKNLTYRVIFNLSQLAVATYLVGNLLYWLQGAEPPLNPANVTNIFLLFFNLGVCALVYFIINTGAVVVIISLATGDSIRRVFQHHVWTSLTYFVGASAAAIIFLNFEQTNLLAFALALPITLLIYYAFNLNLERINEAQMHLDQLNDLYHSTIESLAMAIDAKDAKTHGHIQRVQTLTLGLADHCEITNDHEREGLKAASLLHDIGKLAIPEYILNKPSPLTHWEKEKMRKHPTIGADILSSVDFPYPVVPYVRYHHEKWDGTGYPDGLKGEDIPVGARILAVADCYDALRSDRPYRPKLSQKMALEHVVTESGKSYDPVVVQQLVEHIDELEAAMKEAEIRITLAASEKTSLSALSSGDQQAMEKRTVFHEIASTHKEVQALYELSKALGKSLKLSDTLSLLAEKIRNLLPCTSCSIYLLEEQDGKLVPYHTSGMYADLLRKVELGVGDGITGWVTAHKQYLMNVSPAPDFMDSEILSTAYRSCLVMPLSLNNSIVGVISLYSDQPENYSQDHLRFMETIADHAATAIRNAIIYEETQEDAHTDELTGLPNLRYFNSFIERELKRSGRAGQPLSLLMMDLERFKEVNDKFGHKIGNRILIEIAHFLRDQLRESDTCIRYAGDEFIAVLPRAGKEQAKHAILRIQEALDDYKIMVDEDSFVQIGISIGAASFPENGRQADLLLVVADQAMYQNKFRRRKAKKYPAGVIRFDKGAEKSS